MNLQEERGYQESDLEDFVDGLINNYQEHSEVSYPIYIPSKGRSFCTYTTDLLSESGISYKLVIEPQDWEDYKKIHGEENLVELPIDNPGIQYVRCFIKKHSIEQGERGHWQIDDDMKSFRIRFTTKNERVQAKHCLAIGEKVFNKFKNVGILGLSSFVFAFSKKKRVSLNRLAYGVVLIDNTTPFFHREGTVEDWDYTFQLLEGGIPTISFNHIIFETPSTGSMKGGNTDSCFEGVKRKKLYEDFINLWPGRFVLGELGEGSTKGWKLKHARRFFEDYKNVALKLK